MKYPYTDRSAKERKHPRSTKHLGTHEELSLSPQLAREAKAIVALAFRNGPIETVHAGRACPQCSGDPNYCHITDPEMKRIMKFAVDKIYGLLLLKESYPKQYEATLEFGSLYAKAWDDPELGLVQ
jgi:hypothetical protein